MDFAVLRASDPTERRLWLDEWRSTEPRDVYAHPDYVALYERPQVSEAVCAFGRDSGRRVLYPFLLRDLGGEPFCQWPRGAAFDITSAYGYGGAWYWGPPSEASATADDFWGRFDRWARSVRVVSEFVRLALDAPRQLAYPGRVEQRLLNVVCDVSVPPEQSWRSFEHKVRKNVNRARSLGVEIESTLDGSRLDEFLPVYEDTMKRRQAPQFYFFDRHFYEAIHARLGGQFAYFFAMWKGRPASAELVLVSDEAVYSFLGGTVDGAQELRANDLLKVEIMSWVRETGRRRFVLGGGQAPDDGIYRYKRSFAPDGVVPFKVGARLLDESRCAELLEARRRHEAARGLGWEPAEDFFPSYRAPTRQG